MTYGETNPQETSLVGLGSLGDLRLDCYIRSNISRVSERQVEALLERLQSLKEAGLIAEFKTMQWPPTRHATIESQASDTTRGELLTKFEGWADQRGYSLTPAFERRTIRSSLLDSEDSHEKVRVPIVTLALYDEGTETSPLTGVVPYTENPDASDSQTYTIDDWLSALEARADDHISGTSNRPTSAHGGG